MREKVRAIGIALILPLLYMLIQQITTLAFSVVYGFIWAKSHDVNNQDAYTQAMKDFLNQNGLLIMLIAAVLGLLLAAWILRREPVTDRAGLIRPPDGISAAMLVVCGLSLNILGSFFLSLVPFPEDIASEYDDLVQVLAGGGPAFQFLVACLIMPLAEEAIYRGVSYRALRRAFPVRTALVMQALLFAAFHGNLIQFAGVFPVALVLGLVFEWCGSLTASALLHVAFNSANALIGLLPQSARDSFAVLLVILLLAAAGAIVSIRWLYKRRAR